MIFDNIADILILKRFLNNVNFKAPQSPEIIGQFRKDTATVASLRERVYNPLRFLSQTLKNSKEVEIQY